MPSYTLSLPYEDMDSLSGLQPELIFALGVEWMMINQELDQRMPFSRSVHSENLKRLVALCELRGASTDVIEHDKWPQLVVSPYSTDAQVSEFYWNTPEGKE